MSHAIECPSRTLCSTIPNVFFSSHTRFNCAKYTVYKTAQNDSFDENSRACPSSSIVLLYTTILQKPPSSRTTSLRLLIQSPDSAVDLSIPRPPADHVSANRDNPTGGADSGMSGRPSRTSSFSQRPRVPCGLPGAGSEDFKLRAVGDPESC